MPVAYLVLLAVDFKHRQRPVAVDLIAWRVAEIALELRTHDDTSSCVSESHDATNQANAAHQRTLWRCRVFFFFMYLRQNSQR